MQLVLHEADIMRNLNHKNLVRMLDFDAHGELKNPDGSTRNVFYMALELCSGGELFDFIAQTGRFTEPVARYYFS
jgi:serine/threonine protein kinase